ALERKQRNMKQVIMLILTPDEWRQQRTSEGFTIDLGVTKAILQVEGRQLRNQGNSNSNISTKGGTTEETVMNYLVTKGKSKPWSIIEGTGLSRPKVYGGLDRLSKKGLV